MRFLLPYKSDQFRVVAMEKKLSVFFWSIGFFALEKTCFLKKKI